MFRSGTAGRTISSSTGSTRSVSRVALNRPHTITVASGRWTSEPHFRTAIILKHADVMALTVFPIVSAAASVSGLSWAGEPGREA